MYDELVKRIHEQAVYLPEKFSKNAELLDVLMKAADAIEELMRRCEQFQYMPPPAWIPVTERLPEEEKTVLTWGNQETILLDWRHDNKWCCFGDVTHWMPLPEPPKEETE